MEKPTVKRAAVLLIVLVVFVLSIPAFAQTETEFTCPTASGFGTVAEDGTVMLDALCQPVLNQTIEIEPDASITVTVSLANYFTAMNATSATFNIHFAMDRANIVVREPDALEGTALTDAASALADISITSEDAEYTFVIENRGLRSAIFDLSIRLDMMMEAM